MAAYPSKAQYQSRSNLCIDVLCPKDAIEFSRVPTYTLRAPSKDSDDHEYAADEVSLPKPMIQHNSRLCVQASGSPIRIDRPSRLDLLASVSMNLKADSHTIEGIGEVRCAPIFPLIQTSESDGLNEVRQFTYQGGAKKRPRYLDSTHPTRLPQHLAGDHNPTADNETPKIHYYPGARRGKANGY